MEGDAVITIALREITERVSGVTINITGDMRSRQTADAIGDATARILKEIADDSGISEIALSEIFLGRFLKAGRGKQMKRPSKENPIKILRFADKRLWCFSGTMEEAWEFARKKEKELGVKCVAIN